MNKINHSDNKGISYNKYSSIKKYNNDNININLNLSKNYDNYYNDKMKRNNTDLKLNLNYSNNIKSEEKPKSTANYHRRNEKNNKDEIK